MRIEKDTKTHYLLQLFCVFHIIQNINVNLIASTTILLVLSFVSVSNLHCPCVCDRGGGELGALPGPAHTLSLVTTHGTPQLKKLHCVLVDEQLKHLL